MRAKEDLVGTIDSCSTADNDAVRVSIVAALRVLYWPFDLFVPLLAEDLLVLLLESHC